MNKYLIGLFLIALTSHFSYGQTEIETKEWILRQLNLHTASGNVIFKYSFVNDLLVQEISVQIQGIPIGDGQKFIKSIQLENIGEVIFEEEDNFFLMILRCKGNKLCSLFAKKNADGTSDILNDKTSNEFSIDLKKSFKNDDLPNKMKEAINHLIKMKGESIIED
jgi:hypothetical protein